MKNNTIMLKVGQTKTLPNGLSTTIYNDKELYLTMVDYYVSKNKGHELYYGRLFSDELFIDNEDLEYYTDVYLLYDLDEAVCFIFIDDDKANVLDIINRIIPNNMNLYYEGCFD